MNNPNTLISIIIPVYNTYKHLEKCIMSVTSQTYRDLEIILIDDGSTDGAQLLCDKFAKKDSRIAVIHKANEGVSVARNVGMENATGEFFMFVDSDDYLDLSIVEKLLAAIKESKADMSVCGMCYITEEEKTINRLSPFYNEVLTYEQLFEVKMMEAGWEFWGAPVAKLYSRTKSKGIFFPVGKRYEDQYVAHRFFGSCEKIAVLEERLYYYVQHEESFLHNTTIDTRLHYAEAMYDRALYFAEKGISRECVYEFLCKGVVTVYREVNGAIIEKRKIDTSSIQNKYRTAVKGILKTGVSFGVKKTIWLILNYIDIKLGCMVQTSQSNQLLEGRGEK